jgi:hypothetical protein
MYFLSTILELYSEIDLSRKQFGIGDMYIYTFLLRMTDTMTSKNIDFFFWNILYGTVPEYSKSTTEIIIFIIIIDRKSVV